MTRTLRVRGLDLTDHVLSLPLDAGEPDGQQIEVFAREVSAPDAGDRPYLVFLQGGPGQEAPRPSALPGAPAWLDRALRDYRVLMLDQRGTGNSTPYGAPGADPRADAAYLSHLRADGIVRDAEAFREHLGVSRWSVLGQSFGGFCALHYLSAAPESLREAYFTGGLPPVGSGPDEVYPRTYAIVRRLNAEHHERFPGDADRLHRVLDLCDTGELRSPSGQPVSRRLFRTLGNQLGMDGGSEALHYLLERDPCSPAFAHDLATMLPFNARNPLYAVVHESSYADGGVTDWAAARTLPDDFDGDSLLLTGEHLYPWHFEDDPGLAPYAEVAGILADHHWPRLYDADVLASVDVPAAAAIYVHDAFVDRELSEETAALIPTLRPWVTDELHHNGLRTSGEKVLDRLIGLARGVG
ncbi:MAG: alpha/beta fold hydrolase [Marmoricola sp.]